MNEFQAQIKKEYGDDQAIIDDETTAFYAAEIMATKGYAKALAKEQPSIMKRVLSFFKEASNYKNERLSKAAKSYYKLYQKMYAEFSATNRGNNALGGVEGDRHHTGAKACCHKDRTLHAIGLQCGKTSLGDLGLADKACLGQFAHNLVDTANRHCGLCGDLTLRGGILLSL